MDSGLFAVGESLTLAGQIRVTVLAIRDGEVDLALDGPGLSLKVASRIADSLLEEMTDALEGDRR